MTGLFKRSFKWKTTLLIAGFISIILLLSHGFIYVMFSNIEIRNEKNMLRLRIEQFVESLRKDPRRLMASFAEDLERDQYIRITDGNNRVLFEKGFHFPTEWLPDVSPIQQDAEGDQPDEYFKNGQRIFFATLTVRGVGPTQAQLTIELYENAQKVVQLTKFMRNLLLLSTIGGIIFAAAVSFYVASATIRPVGNITRKVREMDIDNLHQRIPLPKSRDELFEMTVTLNGLLNRIDRGFQKQKQFVADASHELRTPLTIIEGHTNMIKRWGKRSPEIVEESLAYILQEANRLRYLTDQLLLAAALDEPVETDSPTSADAAGGAETDGGTDAAQVVRQMTKQAGLLLQGGAAVRERVPDDPVPVRIATYDLQQAVLNVVHNALKFTPEGGEVIVSLATEGGCARLEVSDNGIGIAADELPHLFERFYRADKSRSREHGGSGLGLPITKKLIERAGGSIRIDSVYGEGTVVTILLPLSGGMAEAAAEKQA